MQILAKDLVWVQVAENEWMAESPFVKFLHIGFSQNQYWAIWDINLRSYNTLEELKFVAEKLHKKTAEEFLVKHYCVS